MTQQLREAEVVGEDVPFGIGAPVYLAAVVEFIDAEILELAGNVARDETLTRIVPRHITLAVRNDEDLQTLLQDFPSDVVAEEEQGRNDFSCYIVMVLNQIHPDTGISEEAASLMSSIINGIFELLATEAGNLVTSNS
jgi:hypothetical protein